MRGSTVLSMFLAATLMLDGAWTHAQAPAAGAATASAPAAPIEPAWVKRSNGYTQMLLDVQLKHSPESGSHEGLVQYDPLITDATRANELAQRKELIEVLAKLKKVEAKEQDKNVREDLEILRKAFDLQFREDDYQLAHKVPFIDASAAVFGGLKTLLDDQVAEARRPAAVVRLRKYAGVEPGFKPFADVLKERMLEQMAKPGVVYPSAGQMETELGRDKNYVDGIRKLLTQYKLTGWQEPFAKLQQQLADYDTWVRGSVMPKARTDFRLAPEEYALSLESYGIDIPPTQLTEMAHKAFAADQAQMQTLAAQVAKDHGWSLTDYRDVIRELKKQQITGDAILPFYKARLKQIEDILVAKNLVTLPQRPAIIRLATAAETSQQPAPHMTPPPFLNNTGQRGEFVLPLNVPSATGGEAEKYDDFTFDAVAWTMTAHEARPGHELQFDSMLEHGVSRARAMYAFNSTNVEGWGLYSEWVMQPYEPVDGQLLTLQLRLLRDARAFLDPELQSGKVKPADAYKVLENDVMLSHPFAQEEVERFTYRMTGQANSYFYGYTKLLQLRKDTEAALGLKFDQKKYHDFLLAQGLLPAELLRKAVMEDFVPSQKK
ncbi:MAG: DUF885 domain-containing protein [Acidobacteriota bacterium]|nr:DUF885 domain-containing protein [Acidobacteriota bacterium]